LRHGLPLGCDLREQAKWYVGFVHIMA